MPSVHAVERAERAHRGGERPPLVSLPERAGASIARGVETDAAHAGDRLGEPGQERGLHVKQSRERVRGKRALPRGTEGQNVSIV